MKKILIFALPMLLALNLEAQTNEPAVRLALVAETDEVSAASDVLTAQLSGNQKIQLLERNDIEKVYREQGLSAGNKNYLKLGRILGADGLLLFDVVRTPQTTNLTARLIAVKPGVVLTDGSFPWPLKDTASWAESVATYLNSFLPKLAVLVKDAIPISVVNLRSAVQSADAQETEKQLKLLTIQRLSQERQFFVLERQRMQLLSEEKELKTDESAFWNGSYLLAGAVDQNGYSKDVITISARLTPPKGGTPLLIEVGGSRTNYAEVINRLAAKVTELLKVNSAVKEWNAADEAQQYYDEAKWALRWRVFSEAQAAADSAWALGKRDMDCATVQVEAYEIPSDAIGYQGSEYTNPSSTNQVVQTAMEDAAPNRPWGLTWKEQNWGGVKVVQYVSTGIFPDAKNIDRAAHALQIYYAFSRTLPPDEPKADSPWYRLGVEDLTSASRVLQHFNFVPESQRTVGDKLAELRALSRSVAEWISRSPSVHDSYFVGDRIATHDALGNTIGESPNIFGCKVQWGCFWQERPEDAVALYRELMSSPVFSYVHNHFWLRDLQTPRLAAWNENDRLRVSTAWNNFSRELAASTNVLLQLEFRALQLADADKDSTMAASFTNLFDGIFENREALVANNVEVLYLDWGVENLVSAKTGNGVASDTKESLNQLFYSEYRPKLEAMDREYRDKMVAGSQNDAAFEKQKQYLKKNTPYNFAQFVGTFSFFQYSQAQAAELQPLLAAYKSNLVAKAGGKTGMEKMQIRGAITQVGFAEDRVTRVLNPPTPAPPPQMPAQTPKPAPAAKPVVAVSTATNAPDIATNVIAVTRFLAIPFESLLHLNSSERITSSSATITAHHWFDSRLLLDFRYGASIGLHDGKENVPYYRDKSGPAIALFDPAQARWEVIECPEAEMLSQNNFYHRSVLVHGDLFNCDGGQIRKYDFQNQRWQVLPISDGGNYELFAVNAHLYAANQNMIFEIVNGGDGTRLMASNRRRPTVSALDTQDLGTPTLFAGPDHSLRVCTKNKIFTWAGDDWREVCAKPPASFPAAIFEDGILFLTDGFNLPGRVSRLATGDGQAEFCLGEDVRQGIPAGAYGSDANAKPLWNLPPELLLPNLPAAVRQSVLYLMVDHSEAQDVVNEQQHVITGKKILPKDGYHAALLCFSRELPVPQKLFLKFDAPDGCPPVTGRNPASPAILPAMPPAWMLFTTNFLFCGLENPDQLVPNEVDHIGTFYKPGIWMLPVPQIETAVAAQKQIQLEQTLKTGAKAKSGKTQ